MTNSDTCKFARIVCDGMEKEAFSAAMRAGARGAGIMATHAQGAGKTIGNFLTQPRSTGLMNGVRSMGRNIASGWREGRGAGLAEYPEMGGSVPNPSRGFASPMSNFQNPRGMNFQAGAQLPQGGLPGGSVPPPSGKPNWNGSSIGGAPAMGNMDKFKQFWAARSPWQRRGLGAAGGYGALTAASLPSNMENNAKANWQQQHPVMSWAAQNFGGMPQYNQHSYLAPSWAQS